MQIAESGESDPDYCTNMICMYKERLSSKALVGEIELDMSELEFEHVQCVLRALVVRE